MLVTPNECLDSIHTHKHHLQERQLGHRVVVLGRDRVGDQLQPVEIPSHNICLRRRGGQLACPEDAVDDGDVRSHNASETSEDSEAANYKPCPSGPYK